MHSLIRRDRGRKNLMVARLEKLVVPRIVAEELRRRARGSGVTVEEYLLELVTRDEDPAEAAEEYLLGAEELLEQAGEELRKGDLRQASEKIWGACALAIKAHALAKRGTRIESHRDLWVYKDEVARELGDWVRIAFKLADSMHRNLYENLATRRDVEDVLSEMKRLVKAVKEAIKP